MRHFINLLVLVSIATSDASNRLVIATGYNEEGSLADAEIVRIRKDESQCDRKIADYPLYIRGTSGGLVNDKLVICGGGYFLFYTEDCYQYDPAANEWLEVID